MNLVERAKKIILSPKTEWDVIATEATPTQQLLLGYVLPLSAAAAIAGFIGSVLFVGALGGLLGAHVGFGGALVGAVIHVIMAVVSVFVIGFIIDALAPTFGGQKDMGQAIKVAAYSYTPGWVFGLLAIIPLLGWLAALVGGLYGIYLMYLGLPKLMKSPQEKAVPYLIVVIICAIILWWVIAILSTCAAGVGMMGAGMMGARGVPSAPSVTYDKDSRLGKLEEFGKKMEDAGKRMEEAQKSGDPQKQMQAAMGALGTALSGGKGVEPVQLDVLKPFLPDKAAGLPRTASSSDRSGVAGLMAAKVRGEYGDASGKKLNLEVVDTGGAAGLTGLAGWAMLGATAESENDSRIERMRKDGNRMVREEISKRGGSNSYSVILADRFIVSGEGRGVDFDTVKAAVNSIDLARIESIK
jgi:hypothetical protein